MRKWISLAFISFYGSLCLATEVTTEDADLFLRTTRPGVTLWMHAKTSDGSYALSPKMELSEDSILLVDTRKMVETLDNYGKNEADSSRAMIATRLGYLCEVTIVDTDEDPEDINVDNTFGEIEMEEPLSYCLDLKELRRNRVEAADGNGEAVDEAFGAYVGSGDLDLFRNISNQLDIVEAQAMSIEFDGNTEDLFSNAAFVSQAGVRSPLKNKEIEELRIRSGYGIREHPITGRRAMHRGLDIAAREGSEVVAALDGKVIKRSFQRGKAGKYIVMRHKAKGMATKYFHLSKQIAERGQSYSRGETIALSGSTGGATGPHLHFETWKKKRGKLRPQNPNIFLKVLTDTRMIFERAMNLFAFKAPSQKSTLEPDPI